MHTPESTSPTQLFNDGKEFRLPVEYTRQGAGRSSSCVRKASVGHHEQKDDSNL